MENRQAEVLGLNDININQKQKGDDVPDEIRGFDKVLPM